ncbi:MAG: hypothetical protein ABSC63_15055 [Candidatus Binataceae bacterium]|jgi:hypothetical protein
MLRKPITKTTMVFAAMILIEPTDFTEGPLAATSALALRQTPTPAVI